ncbi:MAG TPA: DEAD/DEAH box helicase [Frankiaceae bacterium]|nr:DEAD/DEAH box helicase [Frankiaceae bacterium]
MNSSAQTDSVNAEPATSEIAPDVPLVEAPADAEAAPAPDFASFGVSTPIVTALAEAGITAPFPIQALTLPIALEGTDVIGQARTGTGKTLAFGIPVLERVTVGRAAEPDGLRPLALAVVPTRELCVQVTEDLKRAGRLLGTRVLAVYGGRAYEPQVEALKAGVEVVVGTPGRLLDLARQRHLDLSGVRALVLDEADEMLDLGFLPDVESILEQVSADRQTMLFSATMPGPVVALARRFLTRPVHIRAEMPDENRTVPTTHQHVFRAHALDKAETLSRVLQAKDRGLAMVFVRTKRTADKVAADLSERGFAAAAVHGDLGQGAREQALRAFRAGKIDTLVATDVAARGIDVAGVTHVINYQCPEDEKIYLHRIGRTGRAGEKGVAVTFVDWDDLARWRMVNEALKLPFPDPPETYSTSDHLYDALDIPRTAKGTLPRDQRVRAGLSAEKVEDLGETGRRSKSPARSGGRQDSGRQDSERPAAKRPTRARTRTRGGSGTTALIESGATDNPGPAESGPARTTEQGGDGSAPARRRRRRGGRGRGTGGEQGVAEAS